MLTGSSDWLDVGFAYSTRSFVGYVKPTSNYHNYSE